MHLHLGDAGVTAVLGPTNTGKTHYAIERMLAYRSGVIGLPLRLLAREVFERIKALRGPSVVALLTGEERIVPERTQYWVCTVEAMPAGLGAEFVAVDEIQLCGDPERGHVFTDRLLHARGLKETVFLGAETMRPTIAALVPRVRFDHRARFSQLSYEGARKISRLRPRSAVVGFSVENVYALAELIRRQKGGAAVVMGALSPRTRNAQVALYQNGDVDYLVATDAIGMGLNLDIDHVAFSGLEKFDGRRWRHLAASELAQIAGRAGRYMQPGSFGVTGEAPALPPEVVEAIETHSFAPARHLQWRNPALDFGSAGRLIASLERASDNPLLARTREADDLAALKALAAMPAVARRLHDPRDLRLLWDVASVPDFRNIGAPEHAELLARLFGFLQEGPLPDDWLAGQIRRIDRSDGDIDTLSRRLAFIRTWTYVAQRRGWTADEDHWRGEARAVEDRLSDALHGALTAAFVDRRTSVLMRRLKQRESLLAEVNDQGEVRVEGHVVGRLEGFRFRQDDSASPDEAKTLRAAAAQALQPLLHLRADRFYNAPDTELDYTEQGGLMWGEHAIGRLVAGDDPLSPRVTVFVDEAAPPEVAEKVRRRLQHFIDRKIAALFEPLLALGRDETLEGLARGFAFRMVEQFGILPRAAVMAEVRDLDQGARAALRKHGLRFGQYTVFLPLLLKPAPTRLRLVLWGLARGLDEFPAAPPPGLVTIPVEPGQPDGYYTMSGYREAGSRAIRIDMLERLADMLRGADARGGFEATPDMLSISGLTLEQFADLLKGIGYRAERGERAKERPATTPAPNDPAAPEDEAGAARETATGTEAPSPEPEPIESAPAEPAPGPVAGEAPAPETEAETGAETGAPQAGPGNMAVEPEAEIFYTFTWAPRRQEAARGADRKAGPRKPRGETAKPKAKGKPRDAAAESGAKSHAARPPRAEKPVDPDNPFAVLAVLKTRR